MGAGPGEVRRTRSVLVLYSERAELPAIAEYEKGFRSVLADAGGTTDIFTEYLDYGRFPREQHEAGFVAFLRDRYAGRRIDVLASYEGTAALSFLLRNRAELFPQVPVVAALNPQLIDTAALPAGVSVVPITYDYQRTLGLALALQPQIREVVVVHGLADFDHRRRDDAIRAIESLRPRLNYRSLSGIPLAAMEKEVAALPLDSMVLLVSMVRDTEGRSLAGREYAERLARVSSVPVYGTFITHLERGTLGGAMTDSEKIGKAAGAEVFRLLAGGAPQGVAPVAPAPLVVNWRALQKWRIPPDRVPGEARFIFRDPSIWDTHREIIVLALVALALQGLLIAGLLLQLRRRHQAEAALRASEEQLRLAVEALPTALVLVDRHGVIRLANAQAESLLGFGAGELRGRNIDILVPDRLREGHAKHRGEFFTEPDARTMAVNRDLSARRKDGSEIPVEIGLSPLRTGGETLVLAAIMDLTQRFELRRKQQELEHIGRVSTMGEIAASLAHELSQPLAAILLNAQAGLRLMDAGRADPSEIREILRDVVADDKRAGQVISTLRNLLRRGRTEAARIDFAATVREVLALLRGELMRQRVEVDDALPAECFVLADKTQAEQVLVNLIMNGVDAMRASTAPQRRLHVTAALIDPDTVCVAVRDAGAGIPAEKRDKIFDAFWTTKAHGMGMGLAVCKSIVEGWGGRIWVEPNEERGVTFFFTLRRG